MLTEVRIRQIATHVLSVAFIWNSFSIVRPVWTSDGCYNPSQPAHSVIYTSIESDKYDRYPVGTQVYYSCEPGYELLQFESRYCSHDGTWTGRQPICVKNVGLDAIMVTGSAEIRNPENVNDGFYNSCSTYQVEKNKMIFWRITLADIVDLAAIRLSINVQKNFNASDFDIVYKINTSLIHGFLLNSSIVKETPVTLQGKRLTEILHVMVPFQPIMAKEIFIRMRNGFGDVSGELCEVAIYSVTAISAELCIDRVSFPRNQYETAFNNMSCFYLAVDSKLEVKFLDATLDCVRRNASIANIDAGRLDYLNLLMEKTNIKYLTLFVANHSSVYNATSPESPWCPKIGVWHKTFATDCCPTLKVNIGVKAIPVKCLQQHGYICEKELESCGSPDKNEITKFKDLTTRTVEYSCPVGFQLTGNGRRFCLGGKWSGAAPNCIAQESHCSVPHIPGGEAVLLNNETTVGSWMQILCQPGLFLPCGGDDLQQCEPSGNWSGIGHSVCEYNSSYQVPYPFVMGTVEAEGEDMSHRLLMAGVEIALFVLISNACIWITVFVIVRWVI